MNVVPDRFRYYIPLTVLWPTGFNGWVPCPKLIAACFRLGMMIFVSILRSSNQMPPPPPSQSSIKSEKSAIFGEVALIIKCWNIFDYHWCFFHIMATAAGLKEANISVFLRKKNWFYSSSTTYLYTDICSLHHIQNLRVLYFSLQQPAELPEWNAWAIIIYPSKCLFTRLEKSLGISLLFLKYIVVTVKKPIYKKSIIK